jgi:hypothetical protein
MAPALRQVIQEAHAVVHERPLGQPPLPHVLYLLPGGIVTTVSCGAADE